MTEKEVKALGPREMVDLRQRAKRNRTTQDDAQRLIATVDWMRERWFQAVDSLQCANSREIAAFRRAELAERERDEALVALQTLNKLIGVNL